PDLALLVEHQHELFLLPVVPQHILISLFLKLNPFRPSDSMVQPLPHKDFEPSVASPLHGDKPSLLPSIWLLVESFAPGELRFAPPILGLRLFLMRLGLVRFSLQQSDPRHLRPYRL